MFFLLCCFVRVLCAGVCFYLLRTSRVGRRAAIIFFLFSFPSSEDKKRDYLQLNSLFGLANNTLNVRNNYNKNNCYEPLERFIGISHKHWNNGKIMGDKSAIIPLDIRNGVILTKNGVSYRTPTLSLSLLLSSPQIHSHSNLANR